MGTLQNPGSSSGEHLGQSRGDLLVAVDMSQMATPARSPVTGQVGVVLARSIEQDVQAGTQAPTPRGSGSALWTQSDNSRARVSWVGIRLSCRSATRIIAGQLGNQCPGGRCGSLRSFAPHGARQ